MVRISQVRNLQKYNTEMLALKKEVKKRIDKILEEQNEIMAAAWVTAFSAIFVGHLALLSTNLVVDVATIRKRYAREALGIHYKDALKLVNRKFMKKLELDTEALRRLFNKGDVDIRDIYKMRDTATGMSMDHLVFIDEQELHRIMERAKYESAMWAYENGESVNKTWDTMKDERVRDTIKASHVAMQGVTVPVQEFFNLVPNGVTIAPLQSGIPEQDIGCRCQAIYTKL